MLRFFFKKKKKDKNSRPQEDTVDRHEQEPIPIRLQEVETQLGNVFSRISINDPKLESHRSLPNPPLLPLPPLPPRTEEYSELSTFRPRVAVPTAHRPMSVLQPHPGNEEPIYLNPDHLRVRVAPPPRPLSTSSSYPNSTQPIGQGSLISHRLSSPVPPPPLPPRSRPPRRPDWWEVAYGDYGRITVSRGTDQRNENTVGAVDDQRGITAREVEKGDTKTKDTTYKKRSSSRSLPFSRECKICLEDNPHLRVCYTSCGHIVCDDCAEKNEENHGPQCPFCRRPSQFIRMYE